jgi:hypothetical protein
MFVHPHTSAFDHLISLLNDSRRYPGLTDLARKQNVAGYTARVLERMNDAGIISRWRYWSMANVRGAYTLLNAMKEAYPECLARCKVA